MRQYGLKIEELKETDYIFGSALPFEELQPDGNWTADLPFKEYQNLNGIEPYACVSFTILNCIEMLIKKQYGEDKDYSDRFLSAISGTKEGGNSPQVVCNFLRKLGVVPQEVWAFDDSIKSFEDFYAPIPQAIQDIAKEFLAEYDFKYEFVPDDKEQIAKALKCSPLLISVAAWFQNGDKYYKPDGMIDNHATTLVAIKEGEYKRVFDSYADDEGDPALKDYDWKAPHSIIMRFQIKKNIIMEKKELKNNNYYARLLIIIKNFLNFFYE